MPNWSLILILLMTQLLSGSGLSYLCIANDGSCFCLDTGPNTCRCCQHQDKDVAHCCCAECEASEEQEGILTGLRTLAGHSCECTHVMLLAELPTLTRRISTDAEGFAQVAVLSLDVVTPFELVPTPSAQAGWIGPPAAPAFALIVAATVVIRC